MEIEHILNRSRFSTTIEGKEAYLTYRNEEGMLDIRHTIVPVGLEGRGIASALVEAACEYAVENGLMPAATCSYAAMWIKRHPKYKGIVLDRGGTGNSCAF